MWCHDLFTLCIETIIKRYTVLFSRFHSSFLLSFLLQTANLFQFTHNMFCSFISNKINHKIKSANSYSGELILQLSVEIKPVYYFST